MSLERRLKRAVDALRSGDLDNEAQVRQAVVVPVLRALGWDDADPRELKPQFPTGRSSMDYALLHGGRPLVFVETTAMGAVDASAHGQLFRFALKKDVPFLVLTDGARCDFFLVMAEGAPAERRFRRLELLHKRDLPECADFLEKHLGKDRIVSGEARRNAETRLANELERTRTNDAIRSAWRDLLEEPDEMLRDLLTEKVESDFGIRPQIDDVQSFLREHVPAPQPTNLPPERPRTKLVGFVLDGERVETGKAIGTLVELVKKFSRRDSQFMVRFALASGGRKRQLVARDRSDLYPGRPDFQKKSSENLGNGWWLGKYLGKEDILKHIRIACDVAGVRFGVQLTLIER